MVNVSYTLASLATGETITQRLISNLELVSPNDPEWLTKVLKRDMADYLISQSGGDPLTAIGKALASYSDADMRANFSL